MKASDLADVHFTGPVRLTRGREVFTSVSWTNGNAADAGDSLAAPLPLGELQADNASSRIKKPKMVRLTRLTGKIGDCSLAVRYVDPDAELEPVLQIVALDDYQTVVISSLEASRPPGVAPTVLGLTAAIGSLAARSRTYGNGDPEQRAAFLARIGDICWHTAVTAFAFSTKLSDLPEVDHSSRELADLVIAAGELAGIARKSAEDPSAIQRDRGLALTQLAIALSACRAMAAREKSDIFAVLSVDISHRCARAPVKGSGR